VRGPLRTGTARAASFSGNVLEASGKGFSQPSLLDGRGKGIESGVTLGGCRGQDVKTFRMGCNFPDREAAFQSAGLGAGLEGAGRTVWARSNCSGLGLRAGVRPQLGWHGTAGMGVRSGRAL
jgi:hypothetical protein